MVFNQSKVCFSKLFLVIISLFCSCLVDAQQLSNKAVQVVGGYSKHGSGDMNGIVFGTEYLNYLTKRFSMNYNIRATINDAKDAIIMTNTITGSSTDASRFTTANVQVGVNGGWSFIRNRKHDFKISLGAFGRYQSASNGSDGYSINTPQITGQPTVFIGYDNRTHRRLLHLVDSFSFSMISLLIIKFT